MAACSRSRGRAHRARGTQTWQRRGLARTQLDNQGFEGAGSTPEQMGAVMRDQLEAWKRTIAELRLKFD